MYGQLDDGALGASAASVQGRSNAATGAETAILAATKRLLAEIPLHELTVAQIIAAAETSRATFYFYFGSKFAVLTTLVKQAADEVHALIQPFLEHTDSIPIEVALRRRIAASAWIWNAHRSVLQATVEHWHAVPELRAAWLEEIERLSRAIATEIDRERAAGRALPGPDSQQLAAALVWTAEECLYVSGLGPVHRLAGEEETVSALTRLWVGALYGSPPDSDEAAA